jgi:hypothetical protein
MQCGTFHPDCKVVDHVCMHVSSPRLRRTRGSEGEWWSGWISGLRTDPFQLLVVPSSKMERESEAATGDAHEAFWSLRTGSRVQRANKANTAIVNEKFLLQIWEIWAIQLCAQSAEGLPSRGRPCPFRTAEIQPSPTRENCLIPPL